MAKLVFTVTKGSEGNLESSLSIEGNTENFSLVDLHKLLNRCLDTYYFEVQKFLTEPDQGFVDEDE